MKPFRKTEVKSPISDRAQSQISVAALMAREKITPTKKNSLGNRAFSAILATEVAIGIAVIGGRVGEDDERPNYAHPETVLDSLDNIYHTIGQRVGFLECATAPTLEETEELLSRSRAIANRSAGERQLGLDPLEGTERYELAREMNLTLVPQDELRDAVKRIEAIQINKQLSPDEILQQTNDLVGHYLMEQFDLGFEYVPSSDPNIHYNELDYAEGARRLLIHMSVLPKESYDSRVLWNIKIDVDSLKDKEGNVTADAIYEISNGSITFGPESLGNSGTLIHELWHSYEKYGCNDDGTNIHEVLEPINPDHQPYVGDDWSKLEEQDMDRSVHFSKYMRKNAKEDFAMSAEHWVFEFDINQGDPSKMSIVDRKAVVAGDWANRVAPNLAEYIAQVSHRYFF